MMTLYNKIPYFRKVNTGGKTASAKKGSDNKVNAVKHASKTKKDETNPVKDIGEFLARGIMMIKQVSLTYQQTNGTAIAWIFSKFTIFRLGSKQNFGTRFWIY
jgi:cell surface protein SprA